MTQAASHAAQAYATMPRMREERMPDVVAQQAATMMQEPAVQTAMAAGYATARAMPAPAPVMRSEPLPRVEMRETRAPALRTEARPLPAAAELPLAAPPVVEPPRMEPQRVEPPRVELPRMEPAYSEPAPAPMPEPVAAAPEPAPQPVPEKRKGGSIFSRVTNKAFDIARQTSADLRDATPAAMISRVSKPEPVMRAPAAPSPALNAAPAQPRLTLDPPERMAPRPSEEDLLDIPAFLRRQAN